MSCPVNSFNLALPTGILASASTDQLRRRTQAYRRRADIAFEDDVLATTEVRDLEQLLID